MNTGTVSASAKFVCRRLNLDRDDSPLTRTDFDSTEDWLRHCHEGGIEPFDLVTFQGVWGPGQYAQLAGALYGHTRREYQRGWEGWGQSFYLTFDDLQKGYRALALANCRGRVMTTRVDITWSTLGILTDAAVAAGQVAFLDRIRRWLTRHVGGADYLWVLERGRTRGLHSHILVYVPEGLGDAFRASAERNLTAITGKALLHTPESRTMLIQPRLPDITAQWLRFRYMMKGLDPQVGWPDSAAPAGYYSCAERAGINPEPCGLVDGKRIGVSRCLDDAAFTRWAALNDFPDMRILPGGGPLYDSRFIDWFNENSDYINQPIETINGNRIQQTDALDSGETETRL